MMHDNKNIMVILSSPQVRVRPQLQKIQQKYNSFKVSVSHTTRSPRSNEVDGIDYNFVSREKFEQLIKKGNFTSMQKFSKIITEL